MAVAHNDVAETGSGQWSSNGVDRMGIVQEAAEFQAKTMLLYGRLVHVGETFNRFADCGL